MGFQYYKPNTKIYLTSCCDNTNLAFNIKVTIIGLILYLQYLIDNMSLILDLWGLIYFIGFNIKIYNIGFIILGFKTGVYNIKFNIKV